MVIYTIDMVIHTIDMVIHTIDMVIYTNDIYIGVTYAPDTYSVYTMGLHTVEMDSSHMAGDCIHAISQLLTNPELKVIIVLNPG